jgi:hypothetical protein
METDLSQVECISCKSPLTHEEERKHILNVHTFIWEPFCRLCPSVPVAILLEKTFNFADMQHKDALLERASKSIHYRYDSRLTVGTSPEYPFLSLVTKDRIVLSIYNYHYYRNDPNFVLLHTNDGKLLICLMDSQHSATFMLFFVGRTPVF